MAITPGSRPAKAVRSSAAPARVPRRCRVVIVDDHAAIVGMMRRVVESLEGYKVVGSASDAAAAREVCRREQPDLIILDLVLPQVSGFSLYGELRGACPRSRVLIFSGNLRTPSIHEALLTGAHGLVEKSASIEEFHDALRAVGAGRIYFSRASSEVIRKIVARDPAHAARRIRLSERERAVLRAIAEGLSSKQISDQLGISRHTVVNHRTRLGRKTGLRGVAQLSRYAVQVGLVADTIEPGRGPG